MPPSIDIGGRLLGSGHPPFLVAELSGNHRQSLPEAEALIKAAAKAGAHAVKLQTYTADTLTLPCSSRVFELGEGPWTGRTLHSLYREAMTPWEWHAPLADCARKCGLALFSTPFDETAVDFLEKELDPPAYKIASFEINHLPLLKKVGKTGKPVILSTGMAEFEEIERAVQVLRQSGASGIILLKCVSAYPADPSGFNLISLTALREKFCLSTGLSDHTMGDEIALGAVALGACLIEKHLTLDRHNKSVDSAFSLEPPEFARLTEKAQTLYRSLGNRDIGPTHQELEQRRFRRSIFVSAPIRAGEHFTESNIRIVRPADGLSPSRWNQVLGSKAVRDLTTGSPLLTGDFK